MAKLVLVAMLLAAVAVVSAASVQPEIPHSNALFASFKAAHKKSYATAAEESRRKRIFLDNMRRADAHAKANPLASFGPNAFADLSPAEFKVYHNAQEHYRREAAAKHKVSAKALLSPRELGDSLVIDWRKRGAVTPVKNQGPCGACWSFATTGNIEGQWFLAGNGLVSLSEQELISCDTTNSACTGGSADTAFQWLMTERSGWIATDASLPYVSAQGNVPACTGYGQPGAQISSIVDIDHDEDSIAQYLYYNGPVSVSVDATSWHTYQAGIMTNCISQQVDHGVLIVGFDDTNVPPYWIIKNSWGASWGEEGYIRLAKGSNQCLISTFPSSSMAASNATAVRRRNSRH